MEISKQELKQIIREAEEHGYTIRHAQAGRNVKTQPFGWEKFKSLADF